MVKEAPPPLELSPSKFFQECMQSLTAAQSGSVAVDFGSAFGRHAFPLAALGYFTVALDYDPRALASLVGSNVWPVRCDLDKGVPIRGASAALVVATEYPRVNAVGYIAALVAADGHLIFETFSAKGGNWRFLPEPGAIRSMLSAEFEIIRYVEKLTGIAKGGRCTVKVFARRNQACA
jgi:hypothetical protein